MLKMSIICIAEPKENKNGRPKNSLYFDCAHLILNHRRILIANTNIRILLFIGQLLVINFIPPLVQRPNFNRTIIERLYLIYLA